MTSSRRKQPQASPRFARLGLRLVAGRLHKEIFTLILIILCCWPASAFLKYTLNPKYQSLSTAIWSTPEKGPKYLWSTMMNIDNRFPGVSIILITPGTKLQNPKLAHASTYFLITMRPTPDAYTMDILLPLETLNSSGTCLASWPAITPVSINLHWWPNLGPQPCDPYLKKVLKVPGPTTMHIDNRLPGVYIILFAPWN